jgi:hypothetical protein
MRELRIGVIAITCATLGTLGSMAPAFGQAQQDDLQPGVNTSAMPAQSPAAAPSSPAAPPAPSAANGANAPTTIPTAAANASTASAKSGAPPAAAGKAAKSGKAIDRIDLDTTQITGNKELPKVMYVVPWKHADLGDLTGKPANSLVDEVLQPVDRDVFNREERYYHTVAPEKSPTDAPAGAPVGH